MFDYPDTGWRGEGGFEDAAATTANAYRRVLAHAKEGLGAESYVHERLLYVTPHMPMTDVSVGLADSQRVWGDTDRATAEMYAKCALRWYKARTLYHYDMDAKNMNKVTPTNRDGLRQMLSMVYMTAGRLLLANSFRNMTAEQVHDLTRIFPMHTEPYSARPVDLFVQPDCPRIYHLDLGAGHHIVTLFNSDLEHPRVIKTGISERPVQAGLGLDRNQCYYGFDFWNEQYLGRLEGSQILNQELRPGEARVIALRRAEPFPQVISTSRHILQGHVELEGVRWYEIDAHLSGMASIVGGEPFTIFFVGNGHKPVRVFAQGGAHSTFLKTRASDGYFACQLSAAQTGKYWWRVEFERS